MRFAFIKFIYSLLDHISDDIAIILALALYKDTVDGLRKGTDDRPELDLVLGYKRDWSIF